MKNYEMGQVVRIGRSDWRIRRITGSVVTIERHTSDARLMSRVYTTKELDKVAS